MADTNHIASAQEDIVPKMEPGEEELDASLDADVDMAETQQSTAAMNMDGAGDVDAPTAATAAGATASELDPVAPAPDLRPLGKKDTTLREFLGKMDEYAPIVRTSPSRLER